MCVCVHRQGIQCTTAQDIIRHAAENKGNTLAKDNYWKRNISIQLIVFARVDKSQIEWTVVSEQEGSWVSSRWNISSVSGHLEIKERDRKRIKWSFLVPQWHQKSEEGNNRENEQREFLCQKASHALLSTHQNNCFQQGFAFEMNSRA